MMKEHRLNSTITSIEPSASIALMELAKSLRAEGRDVVDLSGGEPDFDTPAQICEAAWRSMNSGGTHYTAGRGIAALRERIARKLTEENGIPCEAGNVILTPGAKYAIYAVVTALVSAGDEVLIPAPSWLSYSSIVHIAGGKPRPLPLSYDDNYLITREKLEAACTPDTRVIIICTPNNPTGRVMTAAELTAVTEFAEAHDIYIISDEIYEKIIFDGRRHLSPGAVESVARQVITVNGLSKCAAMTGWRVGYLAADKPIADAASLFYQHTMTCIPEFSQKAALTALDCAEDTARMTAAYLRRRDAFTAELEGIAGFEFMKPEGTFYLWARMKDYKGDICRELLDRAGVVAVPGASYSPDAGDCVRFCFAKDDSALIEAAKRIRRCFS